MIKQLPAERPLPDKQLVLDRILTDTGHRRRSRSWVLPVAAAAAIAVVATGALTVPQLLKSEDAPPPTGTATTTSKPTTGRPAENVVLIDRGALSAAQRAAFGKECAKWIGSTGKDDFGTAPLDWPGAGAKIDKILHGTRIAAADGTTTWTVVVRSGGLTYACVGTPTKKWPDGRTTRNYDFTTFGQYPDGGYNGSSGGTAGSLNGKTSTTFFSTQWLPARPGAGQLQRRIILNGKATPWFSSQVVDGLAYISAWGRATLGLGDKVQYETRQLDKDGHPVGPVTITRSTVVKGVTKQSPNMLSAPN